MKLEVIRGDITELALDAIVNAANSSLLGGGGVDGAIHRRAGPELLKECREIREKQYPNGLPTGEAVITKGYNLPAKFVIHTVGPVYDKEENPSKLLANSYKNSLRLAESKGLTSIAFPAISTGVYGYPKKEAAQVVKKVIKAFDFKNIERVFLCYYSAEDKKIAESVILS